MWALLFQHPHDTHPIPIEVSIDTDITKLVESVSDAQILIYGYNIPKEFLKQDHRFMSRRFHLLEWKDVLRRLQQTK